MATIPKTLHYVFLSDPSAAGQKPWSLVHHVCVRSAVERIRPDRVILHCNHEPSGSWWNLTRPLVQLARIEAPREIFGNPLVHPAHQADVVRLEVLLREGGIYLDLDVFVHRDFDDLLEGHSTVMGLEGVGGAHGTANAVIVAEAGAPFLQRWYEAYRNFRGRGRAVHWNEHSVALPWRLAQSHPADITLLDERAFFWPLWFEDHLALLFEKQDIEVDPRSTYANHLWESSAWERHLDRLTPRHVRALDSPFHRWIRPMVADLPDDYGVSGGEARRLAARRMARSAAAALRIAAMREARRTSSLLLRPVLLERLKARFVKRDVPQGPASPRTADRRRGWGEDLVRLGALLSEHRRLADGPLSVLQLGFADADAAQALAADVDGLTFLFASRDRERIHALARSVADPRIAFRVLDDRLEELPAADVCLLSDGIGPAEFNRLLPKLGRFRWVYATWSAQDEPRGADVPGEREDRAWRQRLAGPAVGLALEECWRSAASRLAPTVTYRIVVPATPTPILLAGAA